MIRRSPWPALTHISWLLKSMKRRPSTVSNRTPLAVATASGLSPACSDQSYIVWRTHSSLISAAVSGLTASITIEVMVGQPPKFRLDDVNHAPELACKASAAVRELVVNAAP